MKKFLVFICLGFLIVFGKSLAQERESNLTTWIHSEKEESLAGGPRGSIAIIGVEHAPGQFRAENFSPAHIRSSLEALDPQVVAVESNPEWFKQGRHYRVTYEAQGVAVPWAQKRGLPVYGIDWIGTAGSEKLFGRQLLEQIRGERKKILDGADLDQAAYQYGLASWSELQPPGSQGATHFPMKEGERSAFRLLNSAEYGGRWLKWIDEGKMKEGSSQEFMEERDNHIVSHIIAAAEKHPGARIAVVIGAAHKADLERKLRAKGYEILGLEAVERRYPVNDGEKMDALLTTQDIAAILSEAWDATRQSRVSKDRADRLVAQLGRAPDKDAKARVWNAYFQARHKMLNGDMSGARAILLKVAAPGKGVRFPHRGYRWRHYLTIQQAAWLELGRIADLEGDRDEAIKNYRRLLETIRVPEYSEDYFSDYLFMATAHNAVKALLEKPYSIKNTSKDE